MKYSIIVPVYNRPDEVDELLESLCSQTLKDFEVIIVEDGSQKPCKDVCDKYASILDLHYYNKENSGPGQTRNYGVERATGEYVIILDSDVVLPTGYLEATEKSLTSPLSSLTSELVAWGGPDASHPSFTPVQKAISYSMTSFFTTGGIRGGKKKLDKFFPRSFNMGIRRDIYLQLGGFSKMRFGEDVDFSYRIVEAGYQPQLFPDAWVWHNQLGETPPWYDETRSHVANGIHRRCRRLLIACSVLLWTDTVASVSLLPTDSCRFYPAEQEPVGWCAQHTSCLYTADGLWFRLY